jgi:hypothetical protein
LVDCTCKLTSRIFDAISCAVRVTLNIMRKSKTAEQLKDLVKQLKKADCYKKAGRNFPFKTDAVQVNIGLLVEQAEKIIKSNHSQGLSIAGYGPISEDVISLGERLLEDAHQYLTIQEIDVQYVPTFAQSIIPPKALFEVARAGFFRKSYTEVEVGHHLRAFEEYCAPFSVRLALEAKLKSMFGFKSAQWQGKDGEWSETDEFKVSAFLRFLRNDDKFFNLPCSASELSNIYRWACGFTHTGNKEFCWLVLKALERLSPLFDYEASQNYRNGDLYVYLKEGMKLESLERELNSASGFEEYKVSLSKDEFEMVDCYFDRRTRKYV